MASRIHRSLQEIQTLYDSLEDRKPLENLVRAFRGIQLKVPNYRQPPGEDMSFFRIGGFHGEPFEGPGKYDPNWWGGYCHHNDVLFPTWHRAYLFHFENALREIDDCEDVTLPFWDECADVLDGKTKQPIPSVLTSPTFVLDNEIIPNPLFSYKFQQSLVHDVTTANERYSKPEGYETVRYPLSGLVGTENDRQETEVHNNSYPSPEQRIQLLNHNVYAWLEGTVQINKSQDDPDNPPRYPDTYSVLSRFLACFNVPEYTAFSNKTSMTKYQEDHTLDPHYMVSIEDPHNAIHLAVGGFYQEAVYNADEILGANGVMGDNETAGFDPIFYLHHCFIDYVFWLWQKKYGLTTQGALEIDAASPGAVSIEGSVGTAPNTPLTQNSYLVPFQNPKYDPSVDISDDNPPWLNTRLVTDIESQLGYTYGIGSLSNNPSVLPSSAAAPTAAADAPYAGPEFQVLKATDPINRAAYPGSFVIRTYARTSPGKEKVEIGREATLSRWNLSACANCQSRLDTKAITPISKQLLQALLEGEEEGNRDPEKIEYTAEVIYRDIDLVGVPRLPGGQFRRSEPIHVGDL